MIFVKSISFFLLLSILFSAATEEEYYNKENEIDVLLQYIESENILADKCDTGSCNSCNCCPGYGLIKNPIIAEKCEKCDCGKNFNCSFSGWFDTKTCKCPKGFTARSGLCKADCETNPCKNSGKCIVKNNDIVCNCTEGYTGEFCDNTDKCDTGSCTSCNCCPGYGLIKINFNADKCKKCDCGKNFGCSFTGIWDTKTCECPKGFTSKSSLCQADCETNPCKNSGKCIVKHDDIVCNCTGGYTGEFCDNKTCSLKCQNNGKCIIKDKKEVCNCTEQYIGNTCDTHKCSLINCHHDGKCKVNKGYPTCICPDDYTGDFCEKNKCSLMQCQNSGKCKIVNKTAACDCTERYFGDYCEKDKCSLTICQNGGKCDILNATAVCICPDNFVGDNCEKKCDCKNGKCMNISGRIKCICYPEYGEYEAGDCRACNCGKGANCSFSGGHNLGLINKTKTCMCPKGLQEAEGVCVDPDTYNPCRNNPCKNGARCEKNGVQLKCICLPGYNGKLCETEKCLLKCQNNGKCIMKDKKPACNCTEEYTGTTCETQKCLLKCQNNGKCIIKYKKPVCNCTEEYTGATCETHKCSLITCQNGGVCNIRNGNAVCICEGRFQGEFCELDPLFEDCDINICKKEKCNCCPGYGIRSGNFLSSETCRKCNCGQLFSCSYTNWDTKICYCDPGYSDVSGTCAADCKNNPCENEGTCTVKDNEVFCVCKEPYTGKLCDENSTSEVTTKLSSTTPVEKITIVIDTLGSKMMIIVNIALSCTVLILILFSSFMVYKYKTKH